LLIGRSNQPYLAAVAEELLDEEYKESLRLRAAATLIAGAEIAWEAHIYYTS
jgi:hypothetical protein